MEGRNREFGRATFRFRKAAGQQAAGGVTQFALDPRAGEIRYSGVVPKNRTIDDASKASATTGMGGGLEFDVKFPNHGRKSHSSARSAARVARFGAPSNRRQKSPSGPPVSRIARNFSRWVLSSRDSRNQY